MMTAEYAIVSVEPTEAPPGMAGSDWFRYVIGEGDNRIRGYRQGERATVMRSVEEIVQAMNERRSGKRGRVHLVTTSKERKPVPEASRGPRARRGS